MFSPVLMVWITGRASTWSRTRDSTSTSATVVGNRSVTRAIAPARGARVWRSTQDCLALLTKLGGGAEVDRSGRVQPDAQGRPYACRGFVTL